MDWNAENAAARWAWLRDDSRSDPRVIEYLADKNTAVDAVLAGTAGSDQDAIRAELDAFAQAAKTGARTRDGAYEYWSERPSGHDYYRLCRQAGGGPVEVVLDPQELAGGGHYSVGAITVSDDHAKVAWTADVTGSESYQVHVLDIASRQLCATLDPQVTWGPEVEFDASGEHVYVTVLDEAMRPHQVVRVRLADSVNEILVEETDERAWLGIDVSSDRNLLVVTSETKEDTACWTVDRQAPGSAWLVADREDGVRYWIDSAAGHALLGNELLCIVSIDRGERSIRAGRHGVGPRQWDVLVDSTPAMLLSGAAPVGRDHLVLDVRVDGFPAVAVLHAHGPETRTELLETPSTGAMVTLSHEPLPQWRDGTLRVVANGYCTPEQTWERSVCSGTWNLTHAEQAPEGVDLREFDCGSTWVASHDGTLVPVSWFAPRNTPVNGVVLYGYGAYGVCDDPQFVPSWVPLARRGVACAVAHVRGGGELGEAWHADGRADAKTNGFHDFIAATRWAKEAFSTTKVVARGGSAGGLMVGAALNMAPDEFCAVIADVPFVDCLSTMLDPELPLTVTEYDEWGNPQDAHAHATIKSYTPVLNVQRRRYPPVLATCGLHDPRVGYWEAAKWVAVIEEAAPGENLALLRTRDTGHSGASGLSEYYDEIAEGHAFTIAALDGRLN